MPILVPKDEGGIKPPPRTEERTQTRISVYGEYLSNAPKSRNVTVGNSSWAKTEPTRSPLTVRVWVT